MKNTYAEFICDFCGFAEHFLVNKAPKGYKRKSAEYEARRYNWIITSDNRHFCKKDCYKNYKKGLK